uniref:Uncharacterized protein n=1 Tax=Vespula pensylvanica TaxID=30213 RepID=A0A834P478_VESPE|nr:hypothetical protein H0235_007192 [Vespula pensylvanica]
MPPPGNSYSPVKNSNFGQRENFSRNPSFVLGSHDVRRGGTPKRATSSFVLGSHDVRRGGTPKRATSSLITCDLQGIEIYNEVFPVQERRKSVCCGASNWFSSTMCMGLR